MSGFLPVDSLDSPRFCGLPTFMRLPQASGEDALDAAIVGLPCDSGASQSIDLGYEVITGDAMFEMGFTEAAARIAQRVGVHPVYCTFDLDFVDPACAPGVQTPESGGPSTRGTLALLRALSPMNVVGADVVETNPLFDGPGQITALLTATVVREILSLIAAGCAPSARD